MLGLVILVALQFAIALVGAPFLMKLVPIKGDLAVLALGAMHGVIAWIVSLVGAFALKDVNVPSARTLGATLVGGLIGAGLTLVPGLMAAVPLKIPRDYYSVIGAIIGYMVRRT
ncbi:MAG: hypothetical protein SH859_03435 [Hyphomicrobium aestuarii]|nr:hypothetical protein [Hyphomicrobium aestuarii]